MFLLEIIVFVSKVHEHIFHKQKYGLQLFYLSPDIIILIPITIIYYNCFYYHYNFSFLMIRMLQCHHHIYFLSLCLS